jgi:hypothetical protein
MSHPESKESDGTSTHTERALQKTAFALPFGSLRAFLDQIQFVVRLLLTSTRQIYLQCRPRYRNVVKTTYVPPVVQRGMRKLQSSHCLLGAMGKCTPPPFLTLSHHRQLSLPYASNPTDRVAYGWALLVAIAMSGLQELEGQLLPEGVTLTDYKTLHEILGLMEKKGPASAVSAR